MTSPWTALISKQEKTESSEGGKKRAEYEM